jgi:integration host factor subunit beta
MPIEDGHLARLIPGRYCGHSDGGRSVDTIAQCEVSMIKSELVECVMVAHPGLYHRHAEIAVEAILDQIVDALSNGNRVEIRGFGVFSAMDRRSRVGRNPRTGQPVSVTAKRVPLFRASKEIREALNPHRVKVGRTPTPSTRQSRRGG